MGRELLTNIFYGDEVANREALMRWPRNAFATLSEGQFNRIESNVVAFFSGLKRGIFGGPITAGDAAVLAAVMERARPVEMIEFGVASGLSSCFILSYAKSAGLLSDNVFLTSFDLCRQHQSGQCVGSYVISNHPELMKYWALNTEVTSATLLKGEHQPSYRGDGPIMAFIDAGHNHPWPVLDLAYLYRVLPRGSWVVLQDTQMMERWIADCIIHNVCSPAPVRGVNLAVAHWPGTKILGYAMAYNSAALQLDVTEADFAEYVGVMRNYPKEIAFEHDDLLI